MSKKVRFLDQLQAGDTVFVPDRDNLYSLKLIPATVMQQLNSDFILLRYDLDDNENIIALAHGDNEIYPDTPKTRALAEQLDTMASKSHAIHEELEDLWINFVNGRVVGR